MRKPSRRQEDQPQLSMGTNPAGRQIRAERDISGIASSGDHAVNIQNRADQMTVLSAEAFLPVAAVDASPGLTNLPERPRLFVGRVAELVRLNVALADPGEVLVQAVHGLGGIGKSTLAAHWAAEHAARHTVTWWITADTPAGIDAGLASLASALQPALVGVLPSEALRERAVQWLASHQGWLVVLDNVSDPRDIAPLLAQASAGRYLITSRRASGWHGLAQSIRLNVLDSAEALDLLTQVVGAAASRDIEGAMALCTELGCLPLAIEQAGAYIAQAGVTPRDYLDLLGDYPAKMYKAAAEGGDAARTIARIWHVTLDRLADEPLSGQVLRLLAWYAPDAVPRTVLDGIGSPPELISAIGRLAAYSMLTARPGDVTVHRLVQAVARTPEPGDLHRDDQAIDAAREQATAQLTAAIPDDDPAHWPTWRILLPHINALASHTSSLTDGEAAAGLFHEVGVFLLGQGQVAQAVTYLQRAVTSLGRVLGSDHRNTLIARNSLGGVYLEAGDLGQAIPLLEQCCVDLARVFGDDDVGTLAARNNLALAHMAAGHLGQAIPMLKQNLAERQRVLGGDHPDTLTARNNLAKAYQEAKNSSRAIDLFEQNLPELQRILGSDHPKTLTARGNIAAAYLEAGESSRAIPLFEQTLAAQQRLLGNDHPDVLDCRSDLARAHQHAGDPDRAIPMLKEVLADRQRILGSDHPKTLTSRNNLARAHQDAQDLDQAISLFQQNLVELDRVLGSDHLQTMAGRYSLGGAYLQAGDLDRAIRLFKRSLTDQQRVLGSDHPDTLASRNNLAHAYLDIGRPSRAIRLFEQNLADKQRVLGHDHQDTLTTCHALALAHMAAGHLDLAISLFKQSCADLARVLGSDHSYTLAARNNLARAYLAAGDLKIFRK